MFYLAVIAGALIALIISFNEALPKPDFKFNIFFKQNIGSTLLNIICGCVLVFFKDNIESILTINGINAVILGTSGQFVWKKVVKIFNPQNETYIGINKK